MQKIYILQMHSRTLPANIIKFFTGYPYSHITLSLDSDCYTTYSFGRRKVHSIINSGFITERQDGPFFSYFNKTVCRIFEIEISDEKYERLKAELAVMVEDPYKYRYDMIGIVPRLMGIAFTRKNRFVCSNFVADMLERSDICQFDKPACLIKPRDFESIENIKEIYTGPYKQFVG